jgi:hypothetical protein
MFIVQVPWHNIDILLLHVLLIITQEQSGSLISKPLVDPESVKIGANHIFQVVHAKVAIHVKV